MSAVRDRVLRLLRDVTGGDDVAGAPDLPLYDSGLLDSLGSVSLMLAFADEFGITIAPSEFDKDAWATPAKLVADVERRVAAKAATTA